MRVIDEILFCSLFHANGWNQYQRSHMDLMTFTKLPTTEKWHIFDSLCWSQSLISLPEDTVFIVQLINKRMYAKLKHKNKLTQEKLNYSPFCGATICLFRSRSLILVVAFFFFVFLKNFHWQNRRGVFLKGRQTLNDIIKRNIKGSYPSEPCRIHTYTFCLYLSPASCHVEVVSTSLYSLIHWDRHRWMQKGYSSKTNSLKCVIFQSRLKGTWLKGCRNERGITGGKLEEINWRSVCHELSSSWYFLANTDVNNQGCSNWKDICLIRWNTRIWQNQLGRGYNEFKVP